MGAYKWEKLGQKYMLEGVKGPSAQEVEKQRGFCQANNKSFFLLLFAFFYYQFALLKFRLVLMSFLMFLYIYLYMNSVVNFQIQFVKY